jgi:hypothetical protein
MFKNCCLAYLALLICAQTLSSASPHSSIAELENYDQAIHHINIQLPNDRNDPNFLACRFNIGGQPFVICDNENCHTLANPIAASTELQKLPMLPASLSLYSPYVDPLERWLVKKAGGVEFMESDAQFDLSPHKALKGITIQAVVFQRTILLPNFRQLDQVVHAGEEQGMPLYKWSAIKPLVYNCCSLERALDPVTVTGSALDSAFKSGDLSLKFTQNYPTNTGYIVPVYRHQIFEAPLLAPVNNPMYYMLLDNPDFHMYIIDKPAGCVAPKGHNIYPWKLKLA